MPGWAYNSLLFYLTDTTNPISSPTKTQSDYENKLSYWNNIFFIPTGTFNPGIDRRGWVFLINTGWTWLEPQIFEQQQYAPIWMWFHELKYNGNSIEWCYLDRSYIGQHWCFEQQYINPVASGGELIYGNKQLTGTVTVSSGSKNVTGVNALFNSEISSGDTVVIAGEEIVVDSITSDTSLTLVSTHSAGANGVPIYEKIYIVEPGKLEGFGVRLYVHNLRGNGDEGMRAFIINSSSQVFMSTETVDQPSKQLTYVKVTSF